LRKANFTYIAWVETLTRLTLIVIIVKAVWTVPYTENFWTVFHCNIQTANY